MHYRQALRAVGYDSPTRVRCSGGAVRAGAPRDLTAYSDFKLNKEGLLESLSLGGFSLADSTVLGPRSTRGPGGLRGRVYSAYESRAADVLFILLEIRNTADASRVVSLPTTVYRCPGGASQPVVDATSTDPFTIEAGESTALGLGFARCELGGSVSLAVQGTGAAGKDVRYRLTVPRS
jgi:hypothetical protein